MESVLVIVLAETRAHQQTFPLFKKNLLEVFQADLCLCIANNDREDPNNPFYQHAKYIWTYDEPDDWGEAFDDAQKIDGYSANWRGLLEIKSQWLGGILGPEAHPGSAGILLFFRWFLKEQILQKNVLERYDRFIVTRSDYLHQIPHVPLEYLLSEYIWIPRGEDYGGFCDRHLIAHKNDLLEILAMSDEIISNPAQLYKRMAHRRNWNLEKYIKFYFESAGLSWKVKRFPTSMYTIRSKDGHTRWREGVFNRKLGFYIKYETEYRAVIIARKILGRDGEWSAAKFYIIIFVSIIDDMVREVFSIKPRRIIISFIKKVKYALFTVIKSINSFKP